MIPHQARWVHKQIFRGQYPPSKIIELKINHNVSIWANRTVLNIFIHKNENTPRLFESILENYTSLYQMIMSNYFYFLNPDHDMTQINLINEISC